MDPVATACTIVRLGIVIVSLVEEVQENREKCIDLGDRVKRLQPLGRRFESMAREELEDDLTIDTLFYMVTLFQEIEIFLTELKDSKKKGMFNDLLRFGNEAKDREKLKSKFEEFNKKLDRITGDYTAMGTEKVAQMLREQKHSLLDGLEKMYCEDPPKEDSDDERASLGEGMFGETIRKKNKADSRIYAVKKIKVSKAQANGVTVAMMKNECAILEQLSHPHIARYFVSYFSKQGKFFNIVMELINGGSLADQIKTSPKCSEEQILKWIQQLAFALKYMHEERILHRDLKPENILLTSSSKVKIVDLGFACVAASIAANVTKVGTLLYASYEKSQGFVYDGRDDMWAVGCVLLELLLGYHLHEHGGGSINHPDHPDATRRRRQLLTAAAEISPYLGQELLPQLLQPLQQDRLTSTQFLYFLTGTPAAVSPIHISSPLSNTSPYLSSTPNPVATSPTVSSSLDLPALVHRLSSQSASQVESGISAIWSLSYEADNQKEIVAAEATPPLVQLLDHRSDASKGNAAGALWNLAVDADNKKKITAAGAIPLLVQLLSHRRTQQEP